MCLQAIRVMAQKLPETEEEMLKIPHVTRANFVKYGAPLLEVTQRAPTHFCRVMKTSFASSHKETEDVNVSLIL